MKTCTKCHIEKPLEMFVRRAASKDGRAPHCKECDKEYNNSPIRRERLKEQWEDAWTIKKKKARNAVAHAVEDGSLQSAKCFKCKICDEQAAEYHHYRGYSKKHWLTIVPLCASCNRSLH